MTSGSFNNVMDIRKERTKFINKQIKKLQLGIYVSGKIIIVLSNKYMFILAYKNICTNIN